MDTGLDSPIREAIANEVKSVIASSKQDMLNNMSAMMNSRLNRLQSNIQQSQFDISNAQITKIEESVSNNYKFQRKGNENQFRHSVKVISKLTEARSLLDTPDVSLSKVAAAKDKISEGIDLVQEPQWLHHQQPAKTTSASTVSSITTYPVSSTTTSQVQLITTCQVFSTTTSPVSLITDIPSGLYKSRSSVFNNNQPKIFNNNQLIVFNNNKFRVFNNNLPNVLNNTQHSVCNDNMFRGFDNIMFRGFDNIMFRGFNNNLPRVFNINMPSVLNNYQSSFCNNNLLSGFIDKQPSHCKCFHHLPPQCPQHQAQCLQQQPAKSLNSYKLFKIFRKQHAQFRQ
ncbi:unnamed protein product [Mytilus edulis]|uniref:Uncharacterized protein n=1 Tax=Mytilus edulis TaxID=6550 RepID=A0A8S3TKE4_MYTED|nr:unnamed protein product [Mytilus edulis]